MLRLVAVLSLLALAPLSPSKRANAWCRFASLAVLVCASGCGASEPPAKDVQARQVIHELPFVATQPGTYALAGDLDGRPGEHGIAVEADDVVIDLGGFTLRGGVRSLSAVHAREGVQRLAVRNGTLKAWGADALDARTARGCSVIDVEASLSGGGGISCGPQARISGSRASFNWGGAGIRVGDESVVHRCEADDNAFGGIVAGAGSRVTSCNARRNTYGPGIAAGERARVADCRVVGNLREGLVAGPESEVAGCTSERNVAVGIRVGTASTVEQARSTRCLDGAGIELGLDSEARDCRSFDNSGDDFATAEGARLVRCETEPEPADADLESE